jgi:hypothetical protein
MRPKLEELGQAVIAFAAALAHGRAVAAGRC